MTRLESHGSHLCRDGQALSGQGSALAPCGPLVPRGLLGVFDASFICCRWFCCRRDLLFRPRGATRSVLCESVSGQVRALETKPYVETLQECEVISSRARGQM